MDACDFPINLQENITYVIKNMIEAESMDDLWFSSTSNSIDTWNKMLIVREKINQTMMSIKHICQELPCGRNIWNDIFYDIYDLMSWYSHNDSYIFVKRINALFPWIKKEDI